MISGKQATSASASAPFAGGDASGTALKRLMLSLRFPHLSDAFLSADPHLAGSSAAKAPPPHAQPKRGLGAIRRRQPGGRGSGAGGVPGASAPIGASF